MTRRSERQDEELHRTTATGHTAAAVAGGAMAGAAVRWAVVEAFPVAAGGWPWAVVAVNVVGSFLLGLVLAVTRRGPEPSADDPTRDRIRLALGTGFCGALTTFSTMAVDVAENLRDGEPGRAAGSLLVSLLVGVVAVVAGRLVAERTAPS